MQGDGSQTSQKILKDIAEIYEILLKYGFPGLVSSKILSKPQEIESHLSDYFQPNIKRQNLIEWLILNLNPHYSSQLNNRKNKQKTIMTQLWQLGVMPYSKHTNNLDYEKYVQGLIGYENAVDLIHNLCSLLKECNQYNKANAFFDEIMSNYENLVNCDYDPYKISFPAAYQHLSSEEFQSQYHEVLKEIHTLKQKLQQKEEKDEDDSSYQVVFKCFDDNKVKFQQMYTHLTQKLRQVVNKNETLIQNWQKIPSIQGRTLKISSTLPKIYRQYKQKIRISKYSSSQMKEQRTKIKTLIESINETVCI